MIFSGYSLTRDGALPDQRKVAAILNTPPPTGRHCVMRLLGMAYYLAKFCAKFSSITAPIRSLLQKGSEFCWRPDVHGAAFEALKSLLVNAPVLAYFDPSKKITVQCYASQAGLGAVLLQDGRPVEYAAMSMTDTEQNHAQIQKELLAVVLSLERSLLCLFTPGGRYY